MENSKLLDKLLIKAGKYHPLYGDRLANHLPMELYALKQLGASDNKLKSAFDKSLEKLSLVDDSATDNPCFDLTYNLGNSQQYNNYLDYFQKEIARLGYEALLKSSLPILLPGIAASAFHALIRLAYAIEAKNEKEIAIALAFWCTEFQSFEISNQHTEECLQDIMKRLAPLGSQHLFAPGIIVDRMREIGELLKCNKTLLQPKTIQISEIRQFCVTAFADKSNFTLLHTVTACHAFRIVSPYILNKALAMREIWKAVVIAYLSTGLSYEAPKIKHPQIQIDFNVELEFSSVINTAAKSTNTHVIKLVYTCWREFIEYKDPIYYFVAKRAVST